MADTAGSAYPWAQSWLSGKDEQSFCFYKWEPASNEPPRAIVQIVHGSLDHGRRYWGLAKFLAGKGIVTVASDHRGHGNSSSVSGGLGQTGPEPWSGTVSDLHMLSHYIKAAYPGTPLFVLGHAMGTWLVRDLIQRHPDDADGAILSSPLPPSANLDDTVRALESYIKSSGAEIPSHSMDASIAAYNAPFEPATSRWAWFSRDEEQLRHYENDPQCQFNERADFILEMLRAEGRIGKPENMARLSPSLKVLLLGGEANPVIEHGAYLRTLAAELRSAGVTDISEITYPEARHQLLHEINRGEVYADISDWLSAHV